MEENQNNNQIDDIPLEVLREKYLKKKWFKIPQKPSRPTYTPTYDSTHNSAYNSTYQTAEVKKTEVETIDLSAVTAAQSTVKVKREGLRVLCDWMLLIAVFAVGILTVFSFAVPTTEIGGETFYGKTQNIFDFLYKADDSIINQMKNSVENIEDADFDSSDAMSAVSSVMKILRLLFLLIPTILVAVNTVLGLFRAFMYFRHEKSAKLGGVAVDILARNLILYVFFAFFGSISGGVGEDSYFVGYTVGKGMTLGMIISILLVIAASVCTYRLNASKPGVESIDLNSCIKSLSFGIGYACIGVILTRMKIYSILVYVLTSAFSTALLSIKDGFKITSLIFPGFNLLLLLGCMFLVNRVTKGFTGAFKYLLFNGSEKSIDVKVKNVVEKTRWMSFIPVIILAVLSACAVYVLSNPTYGFGWSVNIYSHFVYIFIISSISQTVAMAFTDN